MLNTANVFHGRRARAYRPRRAGFLLPKGAHFDVMLTVEGIYDYYCMPHEEAGMVGRIMVGEPAGPALPFDYFKGKSAASNWKPVPLAAQKAFPSVQMIMKRTIVRRGKNP